MHGVLKALKRVTVASGSLSLFFETLVEFAEQNIYSGSKFHEQ